MRHESTREAWLASGLARFSESTMLLETLDGFATGLHLCGVDIPVAEWLPHVLDHDGADPISFAENVPEILIADVLWFFKRTGRSLLSRPGRHEPLLPRTDDTDEIIWEVWANGFATALKLRPDAWDAVGGYGPEALSALKTLAGLASIAEERERRASESAGDLDLRMGAELDGQAPDMITASVRTLAAAIAQRAASKGPPGRNDPCPCGSGKKYKKCCGAA
ncbi:UPF0149 family protein [Salinarimonas rosea]|uniref:UPF0149 family protein n=1 Tax=Salinarimonas rosea TaxID=552063 RepID=UPI0004039973|nr:UPF0149 family protein [Salinarimonas rosea]